MNGVLNEVTNTVHKHAPGKSKREVVCGATYHVGHDELTVVEVESKVEATNISKCGRCFEDGGSY